MAKVVHGEIKLKEKMMGQAGDLFCILLSAGYTVEVKIKKDFTPNNGDIVFIIMTEVE